MSQMNQTAKELPSGSDMSNVQEMRPNTEDDETASESDYDVSASDKANTPPTSNRRASVKNSLSLTLPQEAGLTLPYKRSQDAPITVVQVEPQRRNKTYSSDDDPSLAPSSVGSTPTMDSRREQSSSEPRPSPTQIDEIRQPTSDAFGTSQLVEETVARSMTRMRHFNQYAAAENSNDQAASTPVVEDTDASLESQASDSEGILAKESKGKLFGGSQGISHRKSRSVRDTEGTCHLEASAAKSSSIYDSVLENGDEDELNGQGCGVAENDDGEQRPRKKPRLSKAATQEDDSDDAIEVASVSATPTCSAPSAAGKQTGRTPKVLISGDDATQVVKTWFKRKKVDLVQDVPSKSTHFVCVVKNKKLPTTLKVLRSLVAGKLIVTDKWMVESKNEGKLLAPEDYVHPDVKESIDKKRSSLFASKCIFFTNRAAASYSDWSGVEEMLKGAGALTIDRGTAQKGHDMTPKDRVIFFGEDDERDITARALMEEHGRIVYNKQMIAQVILRAELDLSSDECRLTHPLGGETKKRLRS